MLYAILSDIHANLEAFTAVLNDMSKRGVDRIWCLGDIVDYGPNPHECIVLMQRQKHVVGVAGNHDLAALGVIGTEDFHPDAVIASSWTREQLRQSDLDFLASLPSNIEEGDFTLVHASPREPIWEYLKSVEIAEANLPYFKSPVCLFGHTHKPVVFRCGEDNCVLDEFTEETEFALPGRRLLVNPGAVGQPRDGDPRASYAVYDSDAKTVRLVRVAYDIAATQARMLKYKLPSGLITRLSYGI